MRLYLAVLALFGLLNLSVVTVSFAEYAYTENGNKVLLNENGTWTLVKEDKTTKLTELKDIIIDTESFLEKTVTVEGSINCFDLSGELYADSKNITRSLYGENVLKGPYISIPEKKQEYRSKAEKIFWYNCNSVKNCRGKTKIARITGKIIYLENKIAILGKEYTFLGCKPIH